MTRLVNILDKIIFGLASYGIGIIAIIVIGGERFHILPSFRAQNFFAENGRDLLVLILFLKPLSIIPRRYFKATFWKFQDALAYVLKGRTQDPILMYIKNILLNGVQSLAIFLMRWRKQLGIFAFWFVFLHWISLEIGNYQNKMPSYILHPNLFIWMGIIGLFALLIGFLTSNMRAIRLLKTKWKLVQQIAYFAFIGASIHIFLFTQDPTTLIVLFVYIVLKYFERKKTTPTPVVTPSPVVPQVQPPISDSPPTSSTPPPPPAPSLIQAKVINHRMLTHDVMELSVETNQAVSVIPGQWALFQFEDTEGTFNRSYSIVDDDTDNDKTVLIFAIKIKTDGRAGKFLPTVKIGDTLAIKGIYGKFVLQDTPAPKVFLSTGTGLAPLLHMANHCTSQKTLRHSVSYLQDLFYEDRIKKIPNLNYAIHITREDHEGYASGRIQITADTFTPETEIYVCGAPDGVNAIVKHLTEMGYKNIYQEKF